MVPHNLIGLMLCNPSSPIKMMGNFFFQMIEMRKMGRYFQMIEMRTKRHFAINFIEICL